jgi:hypothetical protein
MLQRYRVALRGTDGKSLADGPPIVLDEAPKEGQELMLGEGVRVIVEDVTEGANGEPLIVARRVQPPS